MRAIVIQQFGGPEVFTPTDIPTPTPGPGEVLLRVAATSVNPVDCKIRSGAAKLGPDLPARLHGDVSGVVEALGEGVDGPAVGDRVYGCVGGVRGTQGVLADYVVADHRLVAQAPATLPLTDCAALPLVTLTAWEGCDKAGLQAGLASRPPSDQTGGRETHRTHVLVHGGAGGVGHVALQLAKARGARVATTVSSPEKAALADMLGADDAVRYHDEDVEAYVDRLTGGAGFDVVFDTVGGANIATSVAATRLNGHTVCIQGRGQIDGGMLHARAVSFHLVFMLIPLLHGIDRGRHGRVLREAAALVDAGKLRPLIDERRFTFEQVGAAHALAESGTQVGKVLVVHPDFKH